MARSTSARSTGRCATSSTPARSRRPGRREPVGPQRRDYELTDAGYAAIDEWAAVMKERARLIGEFNGRYLEVGRSRREDRGPDRAKPLATAARRRRGRCPRARSVLLLDREVAVEDPEVQLLLGEVDLQHRVEPVEHAPEADLVALRQPLIRDKLAVSVPSV